jgi:hypothetical protein
MRGRMIAYPCQSRFWCKGQVTRSESCYEVAVADFAVASRIERGQPGDDIEGVAADLSARQ